VSIKIELDEEDFSITLQAIGMAYFSCIKSMDSVGANKYSELDQNIRRQERKSKGKYLDWLSIAQKHGYSFPDERMQKFVAELLHLV